MIFVVFREVWFCLVSVVGKLAASMGRDARYERHDACRRGRVPGSSGSEHGCEAFPVAWMPPWGVWGAPAPQDSPRITGVLLRLRNRIPWQTQQNQPVIGGETWCFSWRSQTLSPASFSRKLGDGPPSFCEVSREPSFSRGTGPQASVASRGPGRVGEAGAVRA